ncbi:class I SAM-dependent methyltransferase [Hydrococcus rivularis]|nr:class I SAM-dependent methyltransferase [Hydrococcus rivularis]
MTILARMPRCPLSDNAMKPWMSMPIDWLKGEPTPYGEIYWCEESQYGLVMPRPDRESVRSFYDLKAYYTHGSNHVTESEKNTFLDWLRVNIAWRFDRGTEITANFIDRSLAGKISSICEIGCGNGELLQQLKEIGHKVCGVEPDEKALAFLKDLDVYPGTAEEMPTAVMSRSFDLVIIKHVLEHCLDPLVALRNAYQLLRSGGILVCEVPNNCALQLSYDGVTWPFLDIPRHLNFFTPTSLRAICEKSGFKMQSLFFRGYTRQFSNSWINTQAFIWDRLRDAQAQADAYPLPKRISQVRVWKHLFVSLLARAEKKYDSVGIIAIRP